MWIIKAMGKISGEFYWTGLDGFNRFETNAKVYNNISACDSDCENLKARFSSLVLTIENAKGKII